MNPEQYNIVLTKRVTEIHPRPIATRMRRAGALAASRAPGGPEPGLLLNLRLIVVPRAIRH